MGFAFLLSHVSHATRLYYHAQILLSTDFSKFADFSTLFKHCKIVFIPAARFIISFRFFICKLFFIIFLIFCIFRQFVIIALFRFVSFVYFANPQKKTNFQASYTLLESLLSYISIRHIKRITVMELHFRQYHSSLPIGPNPFASPIHPLQKQAPAVLLYWLRLFLYKKPSHPITK